MAQPFHFKGEARAAVELRQRNASAIRRGLPALIITTEAKAKDMNATARKGAR